MALLYAPIIDSILPACTDLAKFKIPYKNSATTSSSDYDGFALKLTRVNNGRRINEEDILSDKNAEFNISNLPLSLGMSYKAQIAYIKNGNKVSNYSTVKIFKYTTAPIINYNIENNANLYDNYIVTVSYSHGDDITEKLYSSHFELWDGDNMIEKSEEKIHSFADDDPGSTTAFESYKINSPLLKNKSNYILKFVSISRNDVISEKPVTFIWNNNIIETVNNSLIVTNDFENGLVEIKISEELQAGDNFLIRKESGEGWQILNSITSKNWIYYDKTIKQGVEYQYAIQNGSSKSITTIKPDFEYAFLTDGKRQLKIKYNSKISSFKTTLTEQKINTLGNKYPFITRNGKNKYKEFPISGLISINMDENKLFIDTFNLNSSLSDTITQEREFKLAVLDWLNNGEIKLFRSPVEGNYLVRLINTTLSPVDGLGRMLHTFNTTAVEMDKCDYDGLINNHIIDVNETMSPIVVFQEEYRRSSNGDMLLKRKPEYRTLTNHNDIKYNHNQELLDKWADDWNSVIKNPLLNSHDDLLDINKIKYITYHLDNLEFNNNTNIIEKLIKNDVYKNYIAFVEFTDFIPGTRIKIEGESFRGKRATKTLETEWRIGANGSLIFKNNPMKISSISFPDLVYKQGSINIGYYSKTEYKARKKIYDKITNVFIPCAQFFGKKDLDLLQGDLIEDTKDKLINIQYGRFIPKAIYPYTLYEKDGKLYDEAETEVHYNELSCLNLYKILYNNTIYYYNPISPIELDKNEMYTEDQIFNLFTIQLNNEENNIVNIYEDYIYTIGKYTKDEIDSIKIGPGVIAELGLYISHITYNDEIESEGIKYYNIATKATNKNIDNYKAYCANLQGKIDEYNNGTI